MPLLVKEYLENDLIYLLKITCYVFIKLYFIVFSCASLKFILEAIFMDRISSHSILSFLDRICLNSILSF